MRSKVIARHRLCPNATPVPAIDPDIDFRAPNKDEHVVAAVLGVSVQTVRRLRAQGRGPRVRKIGALCRYSLADVFAWLDAQPSGGETVGASTTRGTS